jgi:hypothetical protein
MEGGARGERDYDGDYDSEFQQRDSRPRFDGEFGDRR